MVALLSYRVEIAPDLDVMWEDDRPPALAFILEDDEHDRLCQAGAPEHWEYADIPVPALIDFMFEKKRRGFGKRDLACEFSRPEPGRVSMRVSFRGRPFMERIYGEDVCHAVFRICGHAKAFAQLCEEVVRQPGRAFKEELLMLIQKGAPKKPSVERVHRETKLPGTSRGPTAIAAPRGPAKPLVIARPTTVPSGPLRPAQVRLYADLLGKGGSLPETLTAEAKAQILSYTDGVGRNAPVDEKTA